MAAGLKTGGRQKGTPNKINAALKDMILGALSDVGGQEYLAIQARENPSAYMTLLGKVLPMQVAGVDGQAIHVVQEVRRTIVDPAHPNG